MIIVGQRSARNPEETSVDGFGLRVEIALTIHQSGLISEFRGKRGVEFLNFPWSIGAGTIFGGFGQESRTFETRPGTNTQRIRLNVAERNQAFESRIDPTVQRNVARTHGSSSVKDLSFFIFLSFVESAITRHVDIVVVRPGAVDLAPHIPAESGAYGHV